MKIMVAFDGSKEAQTALQAARKHARALNARVLLVWSILEGEEEQQEMVQEAENTLNHWKEELSQEGLDCETHLLRQWLNPGEDLVRFAEEHRVDEIVIGVRKRSKVGKLVFGSNAQFIILNAHCTVACVR